MDNILQLSINTKLPKEIEKGNIEYKRVLNNVNKERFKQLVSQMLWRLEEGSGIAYYYLGIDDDGTYYGLNNKQLKFSKKILIAMAERCNAKVNELERIKHLSKFVIKYKITINDSTEDLDEIKIVFTGNTNSGKSTLISVLANGDLDNGYGVSRINMFNHKHEIHSGLTSSISVEVIGYTKKKELLNYGSYPNITTEDICKKSKKIISLIDLPGYKKYTKTTLFGLSTYYPDFICYVISIEDNLNKIINDIQMYINLNKPLFIILSKVDLVNENIKNNKIKKLTDIIENITNRNINLIEDNNDLDYENFKKNIQLFLISCVDKTGIDFLFLYFSKLENYNNINNESFKEFVINDVFIGNDVGLIVSGIQTSGTLKLNDKLLIGCFKNEYLLLENKFKNILNYDDDITSEEKIELSKKDIEEHNKIIWQPCYIKSIHRKQVPFKLLKPGQSATIVISTQNHNLITKNMIIIDKELKFNISSKFKIKIINNINNIKKGSNLTLHYRNIVDVVSVINIKDDILDVSILKEPIYIRNNSYVILRQNSLKYIGYITETDNFYF